MPPSAEPHEPCDDLHTCSHCLRNAYCQDEEFWTDWIHISGRLFVGEDEWDPGEGELMSWCGRECFADWVAERMRS